MKQRALRNPPAADAPSRPPVRPYVDNLCATLSLSTDDADGVFVAAWIEDARVPDADRDKLDALIAALRVGDAAVIAYVAAGTGMFLVVENERGFRVIRGRARGWGARDKNLVRLEQALENALAEHREVVARFLWERENGCRAGVVAHAAR